MLPKPPSPLIDCDKLSTSSNSAFSTFAKTIWAILSLKLIVKVSSLKEAKIILGSSTIAVITVSTLFAPYLNILGYTTIISKVLVLMAIGAGSMVVSHANDSYFWIVVELSGLKIKDAYKARTLAT